MERPASGQELVEERRERVDESRALVEESRAWAAGALTFINNYIDPVSKQEPKLLISTCRCSRD
jgi:hypothetical protein